MDETPEELEQIRREAATIDPYQYRKKRRLLAAVALGALGAGLVWAGLTMYDKARNPCLRLRDHYCKATPGGANCGTWDLIYHDSVEDDDAQMRGNIRMQCERKIQLLKEDDGIKVR